MISFRYHVVSLVAVLLALAIGVALGSGPLQRDEAVSSTGGSSAALATAEETIAGQEQLLAYDDAFVRANADQLLGDALADRAVTLVSLPDADEEAAGRLTEAVETAGGSVTAHVDVSADLLDVDNRQLVDELGAQMLRTARAEVEVPDGVSAYERFGRLLARALTSGRAGGEALDETSESILAAISTAGLVTSRGEVERRGSIVLVLTGDPLGTADQRTGAGSVLAALSGAWDDGSDGVVVAGPMSSAGEDGLVAAVRSDARVGARVSTVDAVERAAGAVTVVLALAREAEGASGHYGTDGAPDGPVPVSGG